jgi:tryptophan-rich sensory protein
MILSRFPLVNALERPTRQALYLNLGYAVLGAFIVNGLIFGLGWQTTMRPRPWFAPPDFVIGGVWIVLLALLAIARWWLNASSDPELTRLKHAVTLLIVSSLIYPFYTMAIGYPTAGGSSVAGLIGNAVALTLGAWCVLEARRLAARAPAFAVPVVVLVAPVVPWVMFATLIVLGQMGWV